MSTAQVIEGFDQLPETEQRKILDHVCRRFEGKQQDAGQPILRPKSFESAQERVFEENAELLRLLAQ